MQHIYLNNAASNANLKFWSTSSFDHVSHVCSREKKYKVTIKHTNLVSLQQLQMLMAGFSTDIPAQALQVLDIVLRDIVLNERNDME